MLDAHPLPPATSLTVSPAKGLVSPSWVGQDAFPVDGSLLLLLPRAGASSRHPDVRMPILRSDPEGFYLEMRIEADPTDSTEFPLIRRIPLESLSESDWATFKAEYSKFDPKVWIQQGVANAVKSISDRRTQRLLAGIVTFLNPRQVSLLLHFYRLAALQGQGNHITFKSNEVLEILGYTRTKDGGFASKLRSQFHRDIVSLHRTELVFPQLARRSSSFGNNFGNGSHSSFSNSNNKVEIQTMLTIQACKAEGGQQKFDMLQAADYTYELAESYSIQLNFWDGLGRNRDYILFPNSLDISQRLGSNAKNDFRMRLLVYLASRIKLDAPQDGQYLIVSKQFLFKTLDLLGTNSSRNNQIFWRTVEELKAAGYLIGAQELPGKRKFNSIQFQVNPEKLRG
ncbi:MAG: hypothetical protein VKJ24_07265 [Synechococcales bacterium]|nr:hypothetical protein [Synechococcales bacterium]